MKDNLYILLKIQVAVLFVLALTMTGQSLLVVRGVSEKPNRQAEMKRYYEKMCTRLDACGIKYRSEYDNHLTEQSFAGISLALFPFSSTLDDETFKTVESFVNNGGKLAVFFSDDARIARLLGLQKVVYVGPDKMGQAAKVAFSQTGPVVGLPERMAQASHNIMEPQLQEGTSVVLAEWCDAGDRKLDHIAATINKNGIYFSHVYLDQDPVAGADFLVAICGAYIPGLLKNMADGKINAAQKAYDTAIAMLTNEKPEPLTLLNKASESLKMSRACYESGEYVRAIEIVKEATQLIQEARLRQCTSRSGEMRGAWIHSAYGLKGKTWDETIKTLAENGFNAIFANMSWSYVADYRSDVLPVHPDVERYGDQIEECLKACRKYGVELHVWHVCWNMGTRTPADLVKQMQEAGRTQVSIKGELSRFLAPHIEENFTLEHDALLEIVKKYPVDGIHLDYIRYPDSRNDYSDSCRAAFEKAMGTKLEKWPADCRIGGAYYEKFLQWRRNNISRLVETVSRDAHKIRPDIKVSAAVYADWNGSREWIGQDAGLWCKNRWLDFVCPMNYERAQDIEKYRGYLANQLKTVCGSIPVYAGIGAYKLDSTLEVVDQIQDARNMGADGFVCFSYNEIFEKRTLPQLKLGCTSVNCGNVLPHHMKSGSFEMTAGHKDLDGAFLQKERMTLAYRLPAGMKYTGKTSVAVECNGKRIQAVDLKCSIKNEVLSCSFASSLAGAYRLLVIDETQKILDRSPVMTVLDAKGAAEARLKNGPPVFKNNGGIRVAVWMDNAYGAAAIFKQLNSVGWIDAAELRNLKSENLKKVQVIVLAQPRNNIDLFKQAETGTTLRKFVQEGGGLLVTHALVGTRGFVNPVPQIVPSVGSVAINSDSWQINAEHDITRNLPAGIQHSTLGDMFELRLDSGSARKILTSPDGKCVLAAGVYGSGRYVPCGIGLGIGNGDVDVELPSAEQTLLINIVRWLGKR